ncbi:hypothetical protein [Chryseobacterium sp. MYb7]|uniref:hypothetical protein n=1 Tax=Chryseobacterium sp. MYb7 TaxID=1827290 RepID=UPI000F4EDD5B|nr:hypothetical protein [Chryseobacterium sp. MYb7]
MKTIFFIILTFFMLSCGSFKNNKARGSAGIVRVGQYEPSGKSNAKDSSVGNNNGTFLWSYYDPTRRGSVMYVKDGKIRVLAENSPDAAIQSITAITGKANVKGQVDAEFALNTQRTIAQLGKRTAAVNMLRDALYRLNEFYYASIDQKEDINKLLIKNEIGIEKFNALSNNFNDKEELLSKDGIRKLFETIIDRTRDISIAEAEAESKISKAESDASVEKSKAEIKKYEATLTVIQKMDGNLSKEKAEEYLKEL